MIVEDIIDIEKKNSLIYYREEFQAVAIYNILGNEQQGRIDFLIEVNPIGQKQLFLELIDKPDYPILPIRLDLKEKIQHLIDSSTLPL
nr:hypothetical protein [uncultured Treponema sp.]